MYPDPWTNQDLVLYHGTLEMHVASVLAGIDPAKGKDDVDFGRGFYTKSLGSSIMTKTSEKELFLAVVEDCLKEIYEVKSTEASQLKETLRERVEKLSRGQFPDLFFHAEPIHVAGNLAGKSDVKMSKKKRKLYDAILARHDW